MSPATGPAQRSGDPRKRSGDPRKRSGAPSKRGAVPASSAAGRGPRVALVMAALAVGAAVLALALTTTRPGEEDAADDRARRHADAACDLTAKAGEAAEATEVEARSGYAAAVLLLDRAIVDSARAAAADPGLADLDTALQAVHTAGHEGDPAGWQTALDAALAECRTALG